jgi:hypothetical protein
MEAYDTYQKRGIEEVDVKLLPIGAIERMKTIKSGAK